MTKESLKHNFEDHFEFGKNWAAFSKHITDQEIVDARTELRRLLGVDSLQGLSFLDIGCGSGIHTLAALTLGAKRVLALDIDPRSTETAREVLSAHWPGANYQVETRNVFDDEFAELPPFDVVYSWGVLHHTGAMWEAIERASTRVGREGRFVIAIYRKTPLCGFWRWEKRLYTHSGSIRRSILEGAYIGMKILRDLVRFKNPMRKIRHYHKGTRGMRWKTDIVDWLGGYPYESASLDEVRAFVERLGFRLEYSYKTKPEIGVFGSGCAEYRFSRLAEGSGETE